MKIATRFLTSYKQNFWAATKKDRARHGTWSAADASKDTLQGTNISHQTGKGANSSTGSFEEGMHPSLASFQIYQQGTNWRVPADSWPNCWP